MAKLIFVMPVWGDRYLACLEKYSMPSQLADGNLPALAAAGFSIIYVFITNTGAAERIHRAAFMKRLESLAEVRVETFPDSDLDGHKYNLMTRAQKLALSRYLASGDWAVFPLPDLIFSDGVLQRLGQATHLGRKALLAHLPRVVFEDVNALPWTHQASMSISNKALAQLALDHYHPMAKGYVVGKGVSNTWPIDIQAEIGNGKGYVIHSFGVHPLAIVTTNTDFNFFDGNYVENNVSDFNQIDFITDSREGLIAKLSPRGYFVGEERRTNPSPIYVGALYAGYLKERIRPFMLQHSVVLTPGGYSQKELRSAQRQSLTVAKRAERYRRLFSTSALAESLGKRFVVKHPEPYRMTKG